MELLTSLVKYRRNHGYPAPYFVGDEDCLFLNIMRPDELSTSLRPVFVHIHGGGLKHGNSSGRNEVNMDGERSQDHHV